MVQWEGFLLSPGPIQILISQGRYFPMRGCRSLWVGLFKKATKYDFIKGKVNLQGGFVLNPHTPPRPVFLLFSFFYFLMPVDSVISQLDKLVRGSSGKV